MGKDNFDMKFVNKALTISEVKEVKEEKDLTGMFVGFTYVENVEEQ